MLLNARYPGIEQRGCDVLHVALTQTEFGGTRPAGLIKGLTKSATSFYGLEST